MATNDSTGSTVAYPGRNPTADELRALPDALLLRLFECVRDFARDEDDSTDRWEASTLCDDIQLAADIPDVLVPARAWAPPAVK